MSTITSLVYGMSMPCCSNCGRQLRHLYQDHIKLSKELEAELKAIGPGNVPSNTYRGEVSGLDLTDFVRTYYQWRSKNPAAPRGPDFKPHNVIARGLLSIKPLEENMLPFGMDREIDRQLSILAESPCCLRMLQCNPNLSI